VGGVKMSMTKISSAAISPALLLLLAVFPLAGAVDAPSGRKTVASEDSALSEREIQNRERTLGELRQQLAQASELAVKKSYAESQNVIQSVIQFLNEMPGAAAAKLGRQAREQLTDLKQLWSADIFRQAQELAEAGNYDNAILKASEAGDIDTSVQEKVRNFKHYCQESKKRKEFRDGTVPALYDPNYDLSQKSQSILYREAVTLFQNRKYEEARRRLEKIYLMDPYDTKAIALMGKVYQQMYSYGMLRQELESERIVADEVWTWVDSVGVPDGDLTVKRDSDLQDDGANLYAAMEKVVFPSVDFKDAEVISVLRFLNRNERYNPTGMRIAIVPTNMTPAENARRVTMSFTNIPLNELLRYICQDLGFQYRIENNVVMIGPGVSELQTRTFRVSMEVVYSAAGIAMGGGGEGGEGGAAAGGGAAGGGGGGEGGGNWKDAGDSEKEMGTASVQTIKVSPDELKTYFEARGVPFGPDASVRYDSRNTSLVVRNTSENLRKMEELVRQLSAISSAVPLIQVEVKFVEISEKDWDELGFQWTFSGDNSSTINMGQNWSMLINNPLAGKSSVESTSIINTLKIFPNFGSGILGPNTDFNLSLTVNAISKNSRADVLSSPRVVLSSGHKATIGLVEESKYPESWEAPEIETTNNTMSVTFALPEFGEYEETGIKMDVAADVSADNYTINLTLNPSVKTKLDSVNSTYNVSVDIGTLDEKGMRVPDAGYPLNYNVYMPEFGLRDLIVNAKVYDGETIVIGGASNSETTLSNYEWPFLGRIPLIGRLFRTQSETSTRTNLLIFVTARLVKQDGGMRNLNTGSSAAPNFNR
ncbi:MAG: hypothetical protein PHS41_11810, partial [Victivallaceae bacterium]|nr:hypothetical protein [Victivallaceae bacterium]